MWEVIHKTCLEGLIKNPVYWSEWQLGQLAKNPSIMAECNIQHTCMLDNMTNIFRDEFNSSPIFQHGPSKGDNTRN